MRNLYWTVAGLLLVAVLLGPAAAPAHAQPVVTYSYYGTPVTYSYYAPPVVAPGTVTTSYYRYGLLGRRVAVRSYATPAPVVSYYGAPAPVVSYYGAPTVTTYYRPRRVVTYYSAPVYCPW
jgi:hypothetical protein